MAGFGAEAQRAAGCGTWMLGKRENPVRSKVRMGMGACTYVGGNRAGIARGFARDLAVSNQALRGWIDGRRAGQEGGRLDQVGIDAIAAHGLAGEYRRIGVIAVRPSAIPPRPLLGIGSLQMGDGERPGGLAG